MAQLLGVVLYPFIENTEYGHVGLNVFGIVVLCLAIRTVRQTPGLAWISVSLAVPVVILLVLQMIFDTYYLLAWSSGWRQCSTSMLPAA